MNTPNIPLASLEAVPTNATPMPAYQAPAIESIVTFDDLQREVLYAGTSLSRTTDPGPDNP